MLRQWVSFEPNKKKEIFSNQMGILQTNVSSKSTEMVMTPANLLGIWNKQMQSQQTSAGAIDNIGVLLVIVADLFSLDSSFP
ncbi:hypothetical protein CEXT_286031 [Caerostris extrusa]|uniref:Uncharacterized protein n=1 Tax=Caerostris extrusa TaxID=172846 RepID=A0AAV4MI75_CAEEX|nr:hypothetical protein CEXT_286031 [Caerostris extrusa]